MKKIIAIICALTVAFSLFIPCVYAENAADDDYKDVLVFERTTQISHFIQEPWPKGEIRICPAVLETEEGERDVYMVTVRGIDWEAKGPNNFFAYLLMLFNKDCRYYLMAKSAISEYVPEGAAIVIAGHSLGGMVVQRLICDDALTEKYEFLNAVTFGSPYFMTDKSKREGNLVRLEDTLVIVPKCSLALFFDREDYNGGVKMTGDWDNLSDAHNRSYKERGEWGGFDALGVQGGGATVTLDLEKLITLKAQYDAK